MIAAANLRIVRVDSQETDRALVARTCEGDQLAWQALWQRLDPVLHGLIRSFRLGRISRSPDERRAVVVEVMARLSADGYRRLRLFTEAQTRDSTMSLLPWLKVVARRTAIDVMRAHPAFTRRSAPPDGAGDRWTDPHSLPAASLLPGARPAFTRDGTAREMLAHARRVLPERQFQALVLKLSGEPIADIARTLALSGPDEAERMVRAALERLRRRFRSTLAGDR
jgi:DNA-directed RNA polymerase specialized sigma24 family protein